MTVQWLIEIKCAKSKNVLFRNLITSFVFKYMIFDDVKLVVAFSLFVLFSEYQREVSEAVGFFLTVCYCHYKMVILYKKKETS